MWKMDLNELTFVTASDAGGVGAARDEVIDGTPSDATQGAWIICAVEGTPT